MKAIWNDKIIAESNETIVVENNHYFPKNSVNGDFIEKSNTNSVCPWKGLASYYNVIIDGETNANAAWYYSEPKEKAKEIKNYVAFWKGVKVINE